MSVPGCVDSAPGPWAVVAAAGSGERFGADRPKAFVRLGNRPLLAESLERLDASGWVDAIVVAAPAGWEEPVILLAGSNRRTGSRFVGPLRRKSGPSEIVLWPI